jgi:hypothetical protein
VYKLEGSGEELLVGVVVGFSMRGPIGSLSAKPRATYVTGDAREGLVSG